MTSKEYKRKSAEKFLKEKGVYPGQQVNTMRSLNKPLQSQQDKLRLCDLLTEFASHTDNNRKEWEPTDVEIDTLVEHIVTIELFAPHSTISSHIRHWVESKGQLPPDAEFENIF
jgi:hypothetical protein